jgi:hypothetical protein
MHQTGSANLPPAGQLPGKVRQTLLLDTAMKEIAADLKQEHSLMFFARGYNYATALEAALKVGVSCGDRSDHLGFDAGDDLRFMVWIRSTGPFQQMYAGEGQAGVWFLW